MQNHKNRLIWKNMFLKEAIAQTPNKNDGYHFYLPLE